MDSWLTPGMGCYKPALTSFCRILHRIQSTCSGKVAYFAEAMTLLVKSLFVYSLRCFDMQKNTSSITLHTHEGLCDRVGVHIIWCPVFGVFEKNACNGSEICHKLTVSSMSIPFQGLGFVNRICQATEEQVFDLLLALGSLLNESLNEVLA